MTIKKLHRELVTVDKSSVYRCSLVVKNTELYSGLKIAGINKSGALFINRDLKTNGRINTIFFTNDSDEKLKIELKSKCKKTIKIEDIITEFRVDKVGSTSKPLPLRTTEQSVCVAIATYPARKNSLLETIDSLIHQVDYLLLYLNEYQAIPSEINKHKQRNKIICVVDETGERRAEGKFHWMSRVQGYYLTCDDDIIYPDNYVEKTTSAIEKNNRRCVVGYHGVVFKNSVASFKADRKSFYKFTEHLEENKKCHLLGTGVAGFHSQLFAGINTQLLEQYPFAVDPAFAVICKENKISMLCLMHDENWLQSSPYMMYGLHEEKQNFKDKKRSVDNLLSSHNPWGRQPCGKFLAHIKKQPKIRKLINNPKLFFKDSRISELFL